MMHSVFMRAVVEYAIFAGLSGDDVVDPDTAVAQLEQLASILKGLTPAERAAFEAFVEEMATSEEAQPGTARRVAFLRSLAENLGLKD